MQVRRQEALFVDGTGGFFRRRGVLLRYNNRLEPCEQPLSAIADAIARRSIAYLFAHPSWREPLEKRKFFGIILVNSFFSTDSE